MFTPSKDGAPKSMVERDIFKLTAVMRSLFDARTQTLIEAGYITECAEFTPEFDNAVRIILLEAYGEELEALANQKLEALRDVK